MNPEEPKNPMDSWPFVVEQLNEGVMLLRGGIDDLSRLQIVLANGSVTDRVGLDSGALQGMPLGMLLMPDQHERFQRDWLASDPQALFKGRYAMRTKGGGLVEADWAISSRSAGNEVEPEHAVTLTWPSPEQGAPGLKRAESDDDSFEMTKADTIAHVARGIVHDFNNSLMTIRGQLEVALDETPEGTSVHLALAQAMEAAVTTSDLCRRLLNYAKGRRSSKVPCRVSDLLQQAVAITGFGSNVTCEQFIKPGVRRVLADGIEIVQVVNNLLVNAQQAMPKGGAIALLAENVPSESRLPEVVPPGDYVAITVRDRGVGIPDEVRRKIFDPLYTTKSGGSGLGLATCLQIVSAHQGYIDVRSVPNLGSEFIVYLPAVCVSGREAEDADSGTASPIGGKIETSANTSSTPSQLKILVVDDQPGIRQIAQTFLEKQGHMVVGVPSGEAALTALREAWREGDRFDLGIIDMTLPGGMNGEDTFRELCNVDPHFVGVATSGSIDQESLPQLQRKGFAGILPKPFPLRTLGAVVREAMQFHTV